jgi:K+-transporting ATPase KdpF subunit
MSALTWLGALLSVAVLGYLGFALLFPERLS